MEKYGILVLAIVIFLVGNFLFWLFTKGHAQKEYGKKIWKHWPSKLYFWQASVLYSMGFTFITLLILKWGNVLTF